MRRSYRLVALSVLAAYAHGAMFKVVAPGTKGNVQVSVGGQRTSLSAHDADIPYYTGEASANSGDKYKYIVDGKEEVFERTLQGDGTRNDVWNRPVTYANLPDMGHPIENSEWTRGGPKDPIWDDNYIPSIFITGNVDNLRTMVEDVPKGRQTVKFTIIGPDNVQTVENVQFGIHGAGKKHNNAKQSWQWSLPEGQYVAKRNWFKIRHMEEDPTQMREKLYSDLLYAVGAPANRANMVRFFINGEGYGTFNMLDDVSEYSYIRAVFYDGKPPNPMGPLYDGASGADFAYSDDSDHYSAWIPNKDSPRDQLAIKPLTETLKNTNMKDDTQVAELGKQFAIEPFLRFMVIEYLTADWDGYWMQQTNDGAYYDPTEKMWHYLGQDYDATFGVNLAEPEGRDFVKVSYKEFPKRYPKAVMINRLLENDKMRTKFETYLKQTVSKLFNNETLTPRVLAYREFIKHDLEWDRSLAQRSPGINFGWTFAQTSENLWNGVSAPNQNGGGADWGLVEWIAAKAQAVIQEFGIQIEKPTTGSRSTSNRGNIIDVDALNRDQGISPANAQQENLGLTTTSGATRALPTLGAFALAAIFLL